MNVRDVNLSPAELQAIEEHKYFLSVERGTEVSIGEAIEDFLQRFAEEWRREKFRRDHQDQISAIEQHRRARLLEKDLDLDRSAVAEEWCQKYAGIWRAERESLERNGFRRMWVVVRDPRGLHLRPWSAVALTASSFDCDVYVHKSGMPFWNFQLEGRPYMNVKSVIGLLSLGIALDDVLEFIASGAQANQALTALRALIDPGPRVPGGA